MASAIDNMRRALETYKERNKVYGDNYKHFGEVMAALFPKGLSLSTQHEWNRFGVFIQIVSKLTRYVADPNQGHLDSIHDMGVYCFMLEELDSIANFRVEDYIKKIEIDDCQHVFRDGRCINPNCDELDPNYQRHARLIPDIKVQPHHFEPVHEGSDICKICCQLSGMRVHGKQKDPFAVGALSHGAFSIKAQYEQDEKELRSDDRI